jgi:hypothetical protein
MHAPILVFEGDNVEAFASVKDASLYLEPIDVKNGTYEAYDSSGVQLDLSTAAAARSRHGLLDYLFRPKQTECVMIRDRERRPPNAHELRRRLITFISRTEGVAEEELSKYSLDTLVSRIPVVR